MNSENTDFSGGSLGMKNVFIYLLLFIILIISGCGTTNQTEAKSDIEVLPKTVAFQDAFTREFLVAKEEVEPGFRRTNPFTIGMVNTRNPLRLMEWILIIIKIIFSACIILMKAKGIGRNWSLLLTDMMGHMKNMKWRIKQSILLKVSI